MFKKVSVLFVFLQLATMSVANADSLDFDYIYMAAEKGDLSGLKKMSSYGIPIDMTNGSGDTALCIAAKKKNKKAYKTLVNAGANPKVSCTHYIKGYKEFSNEVMGIPTAKSENAKAGAFVSGKTLAWTDGAVAVVGGVAAAAGGAEAEEEVSPVEMAS